MKCVDLGEDGDHIIKTSFLSITFRPSHWLYSGFLLILNVWHEIEQKLYKH